MTEHTNTLQLTGPLRAGEVAELERRHRGLFAGPSPPATIDLSGVDSGDSSALALLLEWQSLARSRGRELSFEQAPAGLRVIAGLTGVAPLLGWNEDDTQSDDMEKGS